MKEICINCNNYNNGICRTDGTIIRNDQSYCCKFVKKKKNKTLCFDFDGVIHSYVSGWKCAAVANDEPVKGIKELIDKLIKIGYRIVIFSSRCQSGDGICCIIDYCMKYKIMFHEIAAFKPPCYLTIDDRALCFNGNEIDSLIDKIESFVPWYKKETIKNKYENISNEKLLIDTKIFDSLSCDSKEGKLLLAAISVLTTSPFIFKNKSYLGSKLHPEQVCSMLDELKNDIFVNQDTVKFLEDDKNE